MGLAASRPLRKEKVLQNLPERTTGYTSGQVRVELSYDMHQAAHWLNRLGLPHFNDEEMGLIGYLRTTERQAVSAA